MGAYYEVSAIVPLDPAREPEYRPILKELARLDVKAEAYGDAHTFLISGVDKMSHLAMGEIEALLAQLGKYATQVVCVATRYEDGDVAPLWIGPEPLAIIEAQIAEARREIALAQEKLARLIREAVLWLSQVQKDAR